MHKAFSPLHPCHPWESERVLTFDIIRTACLIVCLIAACTDISCHVNDTAYLVMFCHARACPSSLFTLESICIRQLSLFLLFLLVVSWVLLSVCCELFYHILILRMLGQFACTLAHIRGLGIFYRSLLSFFRVSPRDWTQVVGSVDSHPSLWSHIVCLVHVF